MAPGKRPRRQRVPLSDSDRHTLRRRIRNSALLAAVLVPLTALVILALILHLGSGQLMRSTLSLICFSALGLLWSGRLILEILRLQKDQRAGLKRRYEGIPAARNDFWWRWGTYYLLIELEEVPVTWKQNSRHEAGTLIDVEYAPASLELFIITAAEPGPPPENQSPA